MGAGRPIGGDGLANPSLEAPLIRSGKEKIPALLVFLPVLGQVGLVFRGIQNWVPVWAWYPDPGYQYLLAGASLVSGGAPALLSLFDRATPLSIMCHPSNNLAPTMVYCGGAPAVGALCAREETFSSMSDPYINFANY